MYMRHYQALKLKLWLYLRIETTNSYLDSRVLSILPYIVWVDKIINLIPISKIRHP